MKVKLNDKERKSVVTMDIDRIDVDTDRKMFILHFIASTNAQMLSEILFKLVIEHTVRYCGHRIIEVPFKDMDMLVDKDYIVLIINNGK